jgi:DeoR/GlpR family transcriptional regulator of sugar metabolism
MNRLVEKRREEIENVLIRHRTMKVKNLAENLHVTPETIRKDLDYLEQKGFLTRGHGNATIIDNNHSEVPFQYRIQENAALKERIADKAFSFVKDGMLLFMTSSSICLPLAEKLRMRTNLTIYTNAIDSALLALSPHNKVMLTGGTYNPVGHRTYGMRTMRMLHGVNFDLCITAMNGCKDMDGPAEKDEDDSEMEQYCLAHSRVKILVSDPSKFHHSSNFQYAKFSDFDAFITGKLSDEERKQAGNVQIIEV